MFGFEWNGKPLIPTKHALDEMDNAGIDMYKAVEILDEGFDCSRSKRKANVVERCITRGNKVLKVVVADVGSYYKIIHAGEFTEKKR
jgi:type II secretory pathway component PulF